VFVSNRYSLYCHEQWRRYTRACMTWLEDPPPWLKPCVLLCFGNSVTVKRALAGCVLRATSKKQSSTFFWGKKCIRVIWLEDFLTSKWPGFFTALAPPLVTERLWYSFISSTEQHGLQEWPKLSLCRWWVTHGRRQCVPQGRSRDSEASSTISSFWNAVLPDHYLLWKDWLSKV